MRTEKAKTPSMVQVFIKDLPRINRWLRQRLNDSVNWLFSTTATSGARRQWLFTLALAYLWARAAFNAHPIQFTGNLVNDLIVYPFPSLFAADILRHVVVAVVMFLLGLRIAANYLDDVFELNDVVLAERYILQSVFASQYNRITIEGGGVLDKHLNSPVYRIGGPGLVKVHLDNVALFEKADGSANPIGPQDTLYARKLDRFERLRAVVELRDLTIDLNVRARTKDGIHVTAQGAQILYSVARSRKKESSLRTPMTYDPEAIEKIVYGEAVFKHFKTKRDRTMPAAKTPGGKIELNMGTFIASELGRFISQRFLSEFLTQTMAPEFEKRRREEETVRMAAEDLGATQPRASHGATTASASEAPTLASTPAPDMAATGFISRDAITRQFYDTVNARALERGMQLHWIDIGTWVLPEAAADIHRQHLDAWTLSIENQTKGSSVQLELTRKHSREYELHRQIRDLSMAAYQEFLESHEDDPEGLVHRLLLAYRERLRAVWAMFSDRGDTPPEELDYVARYLNSRMAHHMPQNDDEEDEPE